MRIVFMGSGRFALPPLHALAEAGHELLAVVTQPDREQGRGRKLLPPPVKSAALERGLRVLQPERLRDEAALESLRKLGAELHVVVAYGKILSREALAIPARGTLNVHASLLPRYRGAAPIAWAIVNGESETGVTTMLLDEGMDTGPILLRRSTPIGPEETAGRLEERLAGMGASLLLETLDGLGRGGLSPIAQDSARATYAPLLKKEDGRVDWGADAGSIERRIRGFQPWPGAAAEIGGRDLKLLKARVLTGGTAEAGTVLAVDDDGIVVACGAQSALRLLEVQPASRHAMSAFAFATGARIRPGQRFS